MVRQSWAIYYIQTLPITHCFLLPYKGFLGHCNATSFHRRSNTLHQSNTCCVKNKMDSYISTSYCIPTNFHGLNLSQMSGPLCDDFLTKPLQDCRFHEYSELSFLYMHNWCWLRSIADQNRVTLSFQLTVIFVKFITGVTFCLHTCPSLASMRAFPS